jgi:ABC-type branched-subunit amino acid transport system ATPase component/ABC-type branched-subunit amino acid transport system permease subunit
MCEDRSFRVDWHNVGGPCLFTLATAALGLAFGTYIQYVASLCLIAALVGVALVLIVGFARVIMLTSGAMMALGAYASTILVERLRVPYLLSLLAAAAFGGIAGAVVAVPASRFRGHYLAMATLVFQFVIIIGLREWSSVTGGAAGLSVPNAKLFAHTLANDGEYLVFTGLATAVAIALLAAILAGQYGKALRAISASEIGSEAFGISVGGYRLVAFVISSAAIGFAGALLAPRIRILDPESFGFVSSILMLAYPIVGGMHSVWGGLLGGLFLRALPEASRDAQELQGLIYAVLVIAVMTFFPDGFAGTVGALARRGRKTAAATAVRVAAASADTKHPSVANAGAALEIGDLSVSFGAVRAVDHFSLRVRAGTIHGLIGPNGAGKTTLFNAISGFIVPNSGSISLFDRDVAGEPSRGRIGHGMTRTFQHVALFGPLTCVDNAILGLGRNGIGESLRVSLTQALAGPQYRARRNAALESLAAVGIDHLAEQTAQSLSLGDQRRLELARAIVSDPRLVLLDEPVSGVSRDEELRILGLLRRLSAERAITMLVIEHNIHFIRRLCERLSVMVSGRMLAQGDPETVINDPQVRSIYFGESRRTT